MNLASSSPPIGSGIDGRRLTTLDLTGTELSLEQWAQLIRIIETGGLPALRRLVLVRTNLDRGVLRVLIIALRRGSTPDLEELDLRRTVGINPGAVALTLESACPRLRLVNGTDMGGLSLIDAGIRAHINRVNSVLNYGILNARQAFRLGLVVTLSSDRLSERGEQFTNRMYAMSTYRTVPIEFAVRGSISISLERQFNGVRVRQELSREQLEKIEKLQLSQSMRSSLMANAPWVVDRRDLPILERRAQCSALFVSSSDMIVDGRALVNQELQPIKNPRSLLEISKERKNEISLPDANILPSAIAFVLVPVRLKDFRQLIGLFDDPRPFGNVVFVPNRLVTLNYVFSPNPESPMEPLRSAEVTITVPDYLAEQLTRFAESVGFTITHIARCD